MSVNLRIQVTMPSASCSAHGGIMKDLKRIVRRRFLRESAALLSASSILR